MNKQKNPRLRLWLKRGITALSVAVLLSVFYLFAILGQPDAAQKPKPQPLPAPMEEESAAAMADLPLMLEHFPTSVLLFLEGAGPNFTGGFSRDIPFEKGTARLMELHYRLDNGGEVVTRTYYPARAVRLIERGGYSLTGSTATVAGIRMIRMDSSEGTRLFAAGKEAAYELVLPPMPKEERLALLKNAQLATVSKPKE